VTPDAGQNADRSIGRDPRAIPRMYLTPDVPGIGGAIKERPEDFVVEEIPLYAPSGEGEHAYLTIRRRSLATLDVIRMLSRHFRVPRKAIGYAGLKDKHAVTTQVFSIRLPTGRVEDYPSLPEGRLELLASSRHVNKLRRGHLAGNRFVIRVRDVDQQTLSEAGTRARRALELLETHGAPARFGPQRFGHLQRNHLLGRALLLGDCRGFLDLLVGPGDDSPVSQAEGRALYAQGEYRKALIAFPPSLKAESMALRALADGAGPERAVRSIGRIERSFYGSALQSAVFNAVLDRRMEAGTLATLLEGDIAITHPHRSVFDVDEAVLADPETHERLRRLELSPSGPMWGRAQKNAHAPTHELELEALAEYALEPGDIDRSDKGLTGPLEGSRRPLRLPLTGADVTTGVDEHGTYVQCAFTLPRGAFATAILEEIMKLASDTIHARTMDA
jgi:tRNA pseudouridine13 synthase